MRLPQTITLTFNPVDEGEVYNLDIETEYPCDQEELLEMLEIATSELGGAMIRDRLKDMREG